MQLSLPPSRLLGEMGWVKGIAAGTPSLLERGGTLINTHPVTAVCVCECRGLCFLLKLPVCKFWGLSITA